MRNGTRKILDCLKRQRSLAVTREVLLDLVKDIDELSSDEFVVQSLQHLSKAKALKSKKISTSSDALQSRLSRYQKQSGLPMQRFLGEAAEHLWQQSKTQPAKSNLKSGQAFLKAARKDFDDAQIEASFAEILKRYF